MNSRLFLSLLLLAVACGAQDNSSSDHTAPISVRAGLPGTCKVGEMVINARGTFGQNVYICSGSNTWTSVASPGGDPNSFQTNASGALGGTKGLTWAASYVSAPVFIGTGVSNLLQGGSYTGTGASVFVLQIDGTGSPDTFKWNKNGGTWHTGIPIGASGDTQIQLLSDGVIANFQGVQTGHTLGDKWVITAGASGQVYSQVAHPTTPLTVVLAGQGAGNTSNADYQFVASFVTPDGETYPRYTPSITVSDHTANGKILISGFPAITDPRVIGWNLYVSGPGVTNSAGFRLLDFLPSTTTSYLYNLSDVQLDALPIPPPTFNNINTAGPWMYGNDGGAIQCLQMFDYGLRLSSSCNLFLDASFLRNAQGNTILGTLDGFDAYYNLHGAPENATNAVQLSDGTGTANHPAIYAAGGELTDGPAGLSQTVVVKGSTGSNCNLVFASGILTSTTCP